MYNTSRRVTIGFTLAIFSLGVLSLLTHTDYYDVYGLEENILILQTGIISTEDRDFAISNDFETKIYQNGKIMRLSGVTTTGEPYYIYQKNTGDETILKGKILFDGTFVSIIQKEVIQAPQVLPGGDTQLIIVSKIPHHTYAQYPFIVKVKVFDAEQNPQANYDQIFGAMENVFVNVTITSEFGKFVTSLNGYTDSKGLFMDSHKVREGKDLPGKYKVNVFIDDGTTNITQTFNTFFRGDYRDYVEGDNT